MGQFGRRGAGSRDGTQGSHLSKSRLSFVTTVVLLLSVADVMTAAAESVDCTAWCHNSTLAGLLAAEIPTCLVELNKSMVWEKHVIPDSATTLNSLGSYHQCKYEQGNEILSGYQMCVLDVLDSTRSYTVITQGMCLPKSCNGGAIQMIIRQMIMCPEPKLLKDYLADSCWGLNQTIVTGVLNGTWDVVSRLLAIQEYTGREPKNVEFHCGDNEVKSWDTGAIVLLSITGTLVMLCIVSEIVEQSDQRLARQSVVRSSPSPVNGGSNADMSDRIGSPRGSLAQPLLGNGHRAATPTWHDGPRTKPLWRKFLKAFCLSDTVVSLLERSTNRTLSGLDGLRSLSMMWIILAHTQLVALSLGTDNQDAESLMSKTLPQQFTLGSSLAIDIFFFLSGMLTTFTLLQRMRKNGKNKFPAPIFILLRYLRLTPLYAYILLMYGTVVVHLGEGPVWFRLEREAANCRTQWWTNLVYVNNFVPHEFHQTCMPWSWYLACDMQYFITGLFILTVYLRWRPVGLFLTVALVGVGVGSGYWLLSENTSAQDNYFDKPYTRVTPFAIGILLGILFVDRDLVRVRVPPLVSSLMMFVSLGVMGCVIYVDYVNFAPKTKPWSAKEDAAYQSFGRLGFALAVAVVSFTCVNNNHGIVNRFLSMGIWEPLGKLTYGAYLVHPIIIRAYYYQQVELVHYVPFNQFVIFVAMVVISYGVAAILWLIVELPFASLTKLAFARSR
eukprot:m.221096 g.221096  ORF g.221096 m.221096 type:complete len:725 (+) comp25799_c0_seq4:2324-4498(+)